MAARRALRHLASIFATGILAAGALFTSPPVLAGFTVPANGPGAFAPRDTCAMVKEAAAFRASLKRAVLARDAGALAAMADRDILLDYGGGGGRSELTQRLAGPSGAALWGELDAILPLGCAVEDGALTLPWFFAQDLGDVDTTSALLTTGNRVAMRAQPRADARISRMLNWQLVIVLGDFRPASKYQHVTLIGGNASGYIATASLRSPYSYRLIAERKSGPWRITALIAGD